MPGFIIDFIVAHMTSVYPFGVSVIIPAYNREKTLAEAVSSVLSQDFEGDLEVIVSDDGSTDATIEIAKQFGGRVRVLEKPVECKDQGAAAARNRGIFVSKYAYVSFLDSDDYYLPGCLSKLAGELNKDPGIGYVYCRSFKEVNANGARNLKPWTRLRMSILDQEYHVLFRSYCINTNSIMVRRSSIDAVGVFDTSLSNGEDSDMWLRLSESFKGRFLDFYGNVYRVGHGGGQLSSVNEFKKKQCSRLVYLNALSRCFLKENADNARLLLISRAMFLLNRSAPVGKLHFLYTEALATLLMLLISPKDLKNIFFKFLKG